MKTFALLSFFLLYFNAPSFCQPEKGSIQACITGFFDGLSEIDFNKIREHTTNDFLLLEDGEVWNTDTLIAKMSAPKPPGLKRENKFVFIDIREEGDVAWVSYHNTAVFSLGEKRQTVKWLESAVLKKTMGKWRIQMLHSTPVASKKSD